MDTDIYMGHEALSFLFWKKNLIFKDLQKTNYMLSKPFLSLIPKIKCSIFVTPNPSKHFYFICERHLHIHTNLIIYIN